MSAGSRLLAVVDAEGQRDREAVLAQARQRAEAVLEEATAEARRIREAEVSVPAAPAEDPRLRTATASFLQLYGERARALEKETLHALEAVASEDRDRLLRRVAAEVLASLPPGVYRVEAPQETWDVLAAGPQVPGRSLRWSPAEGALSLRSEDGGLAVGCGLRALVERYFQVEASRVTRLLLGDEPD